MRVTAVYTLEHALTGADIILCQLRIGLMDGRARDETAAVAAGFPGDETWGPSGLSSYLRGRAALDRVTEAWLRYAPDALFLQLTGPLDLVVGRARLRYGAPAYGLCELPLTVAASVNEVAAPLLAGKILRHAHAGNNHASWLYHFEDETGNDCTSAVLAAVAKAGGFDVDSDVILSEGAVPVPYLRFAYHREREYQKQKGQTLTRGAQLQLWATNLERLYCEASSSSGEIQAQLAGRRMNWYQDGVLPAIAAFLGLKSAPQFLPMTLPSDGAIKGIPHNAIVEVPCEFTGRTARALPQPPLPRGPARINRELVAYEEAVLSMPQDPNPNAIAEVLRIHPWGIGVNPDRYLNEICYEWELGENLATNVR
jgi:6-phospho-beta-glucosidase